MEDSALNRLQEALKQKVSDRGKSTVHTQTAVNHSDLFTRLQQQLVSLIQQKEQDTSQTIK